MTYLHNQFLTSRCTTDGYDTLIVHLNEQLTATCRRTHGWPQEAASADALIALETTYQERPDQTVGEWLAAARRECAVSVDNRVGV
jgi:hypothetical protein